MNEMENNPLFAAQSHFPQRPPLVVAGGDVVDKPDNQLEDTCQSANAYLNSSASAGFGNDIMQD